MDCTDHSLMLQFRTRGDAIDALAGRISATLRAAAAANGVASFVVSGGESPRALFHVLRGINLPWAAVTIVPSDERWVALDDAASNEGMIRRELLQGPVAAAGLVSLYRSGRSAEQAAGDVDARLASVKRPFDFVLLGMGTDGHTASLFPDSPDIDCALASERRVVVQHVPRLPHPRISLTIRALLDAGEIALLAFGAAKRATLHRAAAPGPATEYPLRALLHQPRVPVTTYWAP